VLIDQKSGPQLGGATLDSLDGLHDSDFGKSIVDLGFVENIAIDGRAVCFEIEPTTPAGPVKAEFEKAGRERGPALTGVKGQLRAAEKRIFSHHGYGLKLMSVGFLVTDDSPVIWRGPMVHGLVRWFLTNVEGGDAGRPILVEAPESEAARAFADLAGKVARKLGVLAQPVPEIADANITWVTP
jgi:hypothetical protein